jgi:hypothetical protein
VTQHPEGEGSTHLLALAPGTQLEGYMVRAVLGRPGGFGITYLATDRVLETRVAIKEFLPRDRAGRAPGGTRVLPHSASDVEAFRHGLSGFLEEARILARIEHPNVVRVRGFFEANATAYLVMDYVEGRTLAERLQNEPGSRLAAPEAVAIILAVLDGLMAVHGKGIFHRDVSPDNVYLALDGRPILLDFGAARQAVEEHSRSMTAIVRPGYAPWEQYVRRGQGPWTDVYASAAVLYRMLTGEAPPEAPERKDEDTLVPPARRVAGLDVGLSDAIMRALAIEPKRRLQSVAEFAALLKAPPKGPSISVPVAGLSAHTSPAGEHRAAPGGGAGVERRRRDADVAAGAGGKRVALAAAATIAAGVLAVGMGARARSGAGGADVPVAAAFQSVAPASAAAAEDRDDAAPTGESPSSSTIPAGALPALAARLAMEPPRPLRVGEAVRLAARPLDADGNALPPMALRWISSDPRVVRTDPESGLVSALAPGEATITARAGGLRASVRVEVTAPVVASVLVDAPPPLRVGQRVHLYPRLRDERGGAAEGRVQWEVSDERVARVDLDGTVRAVGAGTAWVTVSAGEASTRVEVTVLAPERAATPPPVAYVPPAYAAPAPPPPPPAPREKSSDDFAIRDRAYACLNVMQSLRFDELRSLYGSVSAHDQYTLSQLGRLASSPERGLRVTTLAAPGQPQVSGSSAYTDFSVRVRWKNSFGGNRNANITLRGTFERNGEGWRMVSCRILGSPDLD